MAVPSADSPCELAAYLKQQYYALLAGGNPISIRFADREVKYSTGNLDVMQAEILRLEALCAKAQGDKPRRYAFRLGAFR